MTRIDEIKERLAKVPGNKWHLLHGDVLSYGRFIAHADKPQDAEFIANAHQDIPYLLAKIEKQDELIDVLRANLPTLFAIGAYPLTSRPKVAAMGADDWAAVIKFRRVLVKALAEVPEES